MIRPQLSCVQVGQSDLLALQDELSQQGWGLLTLDHQPGSARLLLGELEYFVDALIYVKHFEISYGIPAKVVSVDNSLGQEPVGLQGPLPKIFNPPEAHMSQTPNLLLPENDPLVLELRQLEAGADKLTYRRALMNAINTLPDEDVRKGFAMIRKGILELLEGNFDDALVWLRKVSEGQVAATRVDRIKAMRRVAWIMHQQKKRLQAYQAYREIGRFTGSQLVRVVCRTECAGLLMELARSEKGTLEECRRECKKVLEMTEAEADDPDYRKYRATAELMEMETFSHEKKYAIAAQLGDSFVARYPDRPRELSVALLFLAWAHHAVGNYDKAKVALLRVLNTSWPEDPYESWQGRQGGRMDVKAIAIAYLNSFAGGVNDLDGLAIVESYKNQ